MNKTLLPLLLMAGAFAASGQLSVGIRIGPPPQPRVYASRPVSPGAEYTWIDGYWYPVGNHYKWHAGYWSRPPYASARWVSPHHDGEQYYNGYWDGDHGRIDHDHHSDRGHDRDYRR